MDLGNILKITRAGYFSYSLGRSVLLDITLSKHWEAESGFKMLKITKAKILKNSLYVQVIYT